MKYARSVISGKWNPFHTGHQYLINRALEDSERVYVLVVTTPVRGRDIPAPIRAGWISEIYAGKPVIVRVMPDILHDDNSLYWAEYTQEFLGFTPDAVYSSEQYGDEWARDLGCEHVMVDRDRVHIPVSATRIYSNPVKYLDYMHPVVRAHFVKRVALVGVESSGTTTLTRALATHFDTVWAPEFGRERAERAIAATGKDLMWPTSDFRYTAVVQQAREDRLAREANKILFLDTEAIATALWHERYHGGIVDQATLDIADTRTYDLYIVTAPLPWVNDGTRAEWMLPDRKRMHERFLEELDKRHARYIVVDGTHEQRLATAQGAVRSVLDTARET